MKREGMPAQRLEGKRVEERAGERETERERERKSTRRRERKIVKEGERKSACTQEREREKALWLLLLYVSLHLGLPYANWAEPGVLFVFSEVFTLVLGPSFDLFSHCHFGLRFPILPT